MCAQGYVLGRPIEAVFYMSEMAWSLLITSASFYRCDGIKLLVTGRDVVAVSAQPGHHHVCTTRDMVS